MGSIITMTCKYYLVCMKNFVSLWEKEISKEDSVEFGKTYPLNVRSLGIDSADKSNISEILVCRRLSSPLPRNGYPKLHRLLHFFKIDNSTKDSEGSEWLWCLNQEIALWLGDNSIWIDNIPDNGIDTLEVEEMYKKIAAWWVEGLMPGKELEIISVRYFLVEKPNWANKTGRIKQEIEISKDDYHEFLENNPNNYRTGCYGTDGIDGVVENVEKREIPMEL